MAHSVLGNTLLLMGKCEELQAEYEEAARLDPLDPDYCRG